MILKDFLNIFLKLGHFKAAFFFFSLQLWSQDRKVIFTQPFKSMFVFKDDLVKFDPILYMGVSVEQCWGVVQLDGKGRISDFFMDK